MIVFIEGTIAAGKTSLLKVFEKNFKCFYEPVELWENYPTKFGKSQAQNLLKQFYDNKTVETSVTLEVTDYISQSS